MTLPTRFGITFSALQANPLDYLHYAKEAEKLGYDYLFFSDNHFTNRDPYVCMGAVSQVTKSIILGTLVSPIVTRDPVVLANSIYAVKELSNGRAVLGIGNGDTSLKKLGKTKATVEQLSDAVKCIRGLTYGQTYEFPAGRFGFNFARGGVPIFIAATGPKMLQLSGKIADATVANVGPALIDWACEQVKTGLSDRDVELGTHQMHTFCFTSIHEDRKTARELIRQNLIWYCINFPDLVKRVEDSLDKNFWKKIDELKERSDLGSNEFVSRQKEISKQLTDEFVNKFALVGNQEDILQTIKNLERKGLTSVIVRAQSSEQWPRVFRLFGEVIKKYRS